MRKYVIFFMHISITFYTLELLKTATILETSSKNLAAIGVMFKQAWIFEHSFNIILILLTILAISPLSIFRVYKFLRFFSAISLFLVNLLVNQIDILNWEFQKEFYLFNALAAILLVVKD